MNVNVMDKIGAIITARAKRLAPIDTGFLRQHIFYKVLDDKTVEVYTEGVSYAEFLEYGTININVGSEKNPRKLWNGTYLPFMRPAIYQSLPEIKKIIIEELS